MSLLYSIIRVILPSTFIRNLARAIGVLFVTVWAVIIFLKIWWCVALSTCHISGSVAIFEVAGKCTKVFIFFCLFDQMLTL